MPRPRALSTDALIDFTKTMRSLGVEEFEFKGLKVKFDPTMRQAFGDGTPDLNAQELRDAFQRFKETNKVDDADLDWSV